MDIRIRDVDNISIFDIDGELTRPSNAALHQHVKSQLEHGRRMILLNFANVGFVDSFGVGEILASYISIQKLGGKIKLAQTPQKLLLVLKIVGLVPGVLEVFDNESAALQSFEKL
jgi:anti-anti-sigma factor